MCNCPKTTKLIPKTLNNHRFDMQTPQNNFQTTQPNLSILSGSIHFKTKHFNPRPQYARSPTRYKPSENKQFSDCKFPRKLCEFRTVEIRCAKFSTFHTWQGATEGETGRKKMGSSTRTTPRVTRRGNPNGSFGTDYRTGNFVRIGAQKWAQK